jgi:DNA-binding MarR family transcriptional regulator
LFSETEFQVAKNEIQKENFQPLAEIDRVIHEPARLLILAYLSVVESADFLFLMNQTGLTRGNLSAHLSKLEAAGYVDIKKEFVEKIPRTLLSLTQQGREAFRQYRRNMRHVLESLNE